MRILFAAMGQSVHTARWISQISDQGWDIHVFDFKDAAVCPELAGVTTHTVHPPPRDHKLKRWESVYPVRRGAGLVKRRFPSAVQDHFFGYRAERFIDLVDRLKPDILHSLEMQNESYPLLDIRKRLGGRFKMPWIYSCWGNDIYYFGKQPEHTDRVREVLAVCDYFIADCHRDVDLAREFGFEGELLGVFPTAGGYEVVKLQSEIAIPKPSDRKSIALKGYQHWQGRALLALDALRLCSDALAGFTLEIYLPVPEVEESAREFSLTTGIPIKIHQETANIDILRLFGRSRIGFSMSVTDGWPNSMLETMIMGAFPVQSDTISTAEWIDHGKNGLLVPPEDPVIAAGALRTALANDELVNQAAGINRELTRTRIDRALLKPQIVEVYNKVFKAHRDVE